MRYRSLEEATVRLRRHGVNVGDKSVHVLSPIGIKLWGAVDYLVSKGYALFISLEPVEEK